MATTLASWMRPGSLSSTSLTGAPGLIVWNPFCENVPTSRMSCSTMNDIAARVGKGEIADTASANAAMEPVKAPVRAVDKALADMTAKIEGHSAHQVEELQQHERAIRRNLGLVVVAAVLLWRILRARKHDPAPLLPWRRIADPARLRRTLVANGDIMLRTLCLLAGFGWFARQGAALGEATLAANHLLLQLVSFSAFFLDGFAYVAEAQVGAAVGARDRGRLLRAVMPPRP